MNFKVAIGPSSFAAQDETPLKILEDSGVEILPNPYGRRLTESEIITHLDGVEGLIAGLEPLNRRVLASATQLKAIARVGIGMNNVDLAATQALDIRVSNTPDGPTEAVAEMTIAALLALSRGLIEANEALHAGNWRKSIGTGLRDLEVLLVGYGRIGKRVGDLLDAFGARVMVVDPFLKESALEGKSELVSLNDGLKKARVVSLHASGMDPILTADEFAQMQDGVLLLNSSRGELVDEEALVQALESGKVRGAWLDVFWEEPYSGPLTQFKQVVLTPQQFEINCVPE
ncbi:NAD(P)-dependent oxidoreductase [Chloroflexota bacterium]